MGLFEYITRGFFGYGSTISVSDETSYILAERSIWVAKITLTHRDGSTTKTLYLGDDYYEQNELYVGSPEIWPVLESIGGVRHSFTGEMGNLHQLQVSIHSAAHLEQYGCSFADLRQDYRFFKAKLEALYYTDSMSEFSVRMTTDVVDSQFSDSALVTLTGQTQWFDNVEVSKRTESNVFSSMDPRYDGEYGSIVFGSDVIIPSFYFSPSTTSSVPTMNLFAGFTFDGHPMNNIDAVYVRNRTPEIDDDDWFPVSLVSSPNADYNGDTAYTFGGSGLLSVFGGLSGSLVAKRFTAPSSEAQILTGFRFRVEVNGTITKDLGDLRLIVETTDASPTAGFNQPTGRALATVSIDFLSSTTTVLIMLEQPLPVPPGAIVAVYPDWQNSGLQASNYYDLLARSTSTSEDYLFRYKNNTGGNNNDAWVKQTLSSSPGIPIQMFVMGVGTSNFVENTGSGDFRYAYQQLAARDYSGDNLNPNSDGHIYRGNSWQVKVDGLDDDSSGTYTGSANGMFETPADIIRFLIFGPEIGPETTSSRLDSTSFDAVRSSQQSLAAPLEMAFAIRSRTFCEELVRELSRWSRAITYTDREGNISMEFAKYVATTPDAVINQSSYQDEIEFISLDDTDPGQVVNDFRLLCDPDQLNEPKSTTFLRAARTDKFNEVVYANESNSSKNNSGIETMCSRSQALYGRREMFEEVPYYTEPEQLEQLLTYYATTKTGGSRKAVFKIPLKDWYDRFLFDTITLKHYQLPSKYGAASFIKSHDGAGTGVQRSFEGVTVYRHAHGSLRGMVVDIAEADDVMEITIERPNYL